LEIDADGCARLPEGPGLGVELDLDWIDDRTRGERRS
jgi:L-alanine-DL-glutamate epimerase-like enolase superfamily enzyme